MSPDVSYSLENGVGFASMPAWGRFFIDLGAALAGATEPNSYVVAAAAVPTRSHAAALIATGIVIRRATTSHGIYSPATRFAQLKGLPVGTTVIFQDHGRRIKTSFLGYKDGHEFPDGIPRVGVQNRGGLTNWLPLTTANQIDILPDEARETVTKIPRTIRSNDPFIRHFLTESQLSEFREKSSLECVLVGPVAILRQEIKQTSFAASSGRSDGTLQDLIRVRRFAGSLQGFRSDVFSIDKSLAAIDMNTPERCVAVFDGSPGFLKQRDRWRSSNWIVILDRTEPGFPQATQVVNEEFLNRVGDFPLPSLSPPPAGVELVVWKRSQ